MAIGSLAVLLLLPLALTEHQHSHTASRSCATCLVAQHSVAVTTPALGVSGTAFTAVDVASAPPAVAVRHVRSPQAGRAPPRLASRQIT